MRTPALTSTQGAILANEEWNPEGGSPGSRNKNNIQEDAPSNPGYRHPKSAQALINRDKVNFVTGTLTSSVTLAVAEVCHNEKMLFMAFGSHSDDTTMSKAMRTTFRPYLFLNWMLSVGSWMRGELEAQDVLPHHRRLHMGPHGPGINESSSGKSRVQRSGQ